MQKSSFVIGFLVAALVAAGLFIFWRAPQPAAPVPSSSSAPVDLGVLPEDTSSEEPTPTEENPDEVRDFIPLTTYVKQDTNTTLEFQYFYLIQALKSQSELELKPTLDHVDIVESGIAEAITTGSLLDVERLEFLPIDNKYGDIFRVFFFETSDQKTVVEAMRPALSDGRWGGMSPYETLSTEACEWWLADDFEDCTAFQLKGTPLAYELTNEDQLRDLKYSEGEATLIRYGVEGQTSMYALFYFDKTRLGKDFEGFKHMVLSSLQI